MAENRSCRKGFLRSLMSLLSKSNAVVLVACAFSLGVGPALGQALPDAGSLTQQLEQNLRPSLPRPQAKEAKPQVEAASGPASEAFVAKGFVFQGNELVSDAQLQDLASAWVDKFVAFSDLSRIAHQVADAYRSAGWMAHVYLPRQDVTEGVVTFKIVEARFAGVSVGKSSGDPVLDRRIIRFFEANQSKGSPVDVGGINRVLLIANDLPGVGVDAALGAGDSEAETALDLTIYRDARASGLASFDNHGSSSTGRERLGFMIGLNDVFGFSESFRVDSKKSRGSESVSFAIKAPVGYDGWQLGLRGSALRYKILDERFAALNIKGRSSGVGFEFDYPIVRGRGANLYANASFDKRYFSNSSNSVEQSRYETDAVGFGLSGNFYDGYFGGGVSGGQFVFMRGGGGAGVDKTKYSIYRNQSISRQLSLGLSLIGQYANGELDSSEKIYLGGADGVRAYANGQGGGSRGDVFKADLSFRATPSVSVSAFYDWARARHSKGSSWLHCRGAGLAAEWMDAQSGVKVRILGAHGANRCVAGPAKMSEGPKASSTRAWFDFGVLF